MQDKNRMVPIVIAHVTGFFLTQVVLMLVLSMVYGLSGMWLGIFLLISVPLHIGLAGFLLVLRSAFHYLPDTKPMLDIGIANRLTMFRISVTPTIMVLVMLYSKRPELLPWIITLTVLAFITDLLDGWVSRTFKETSRMGQYLDSSSDYVVLLMIGAAFAWYQLIDTWFFILLVVRYLIQWIMVGILFFRGNRGKEVKATFLGKASVFATMTVVGLSVFQLIPAVGNPESGYRFVLTILQILCSIFLGVSLVEKLQVFWEGIRKPVEQLSDSTMVGD